MKLSTFLLCLSLMAPAFSLPLDGDLVVTTDKTESETSPKAQKEGLTPPKIAEMDIKTHVTNRFAKTTVKSKVKNEENVAQETVFFVIIPEQAYISGFIMELGGKNYTAYVQEKQEAKATYDSAVASGTGAAHIAVSARDSNKFSVNVNVEPESKAVFYLTYEELLERKDGTYELVINIHPKQLVKDMKVEVDIEESRPLTKLRTNPIRSGNEISKNNPDLQPEASIEHKPETPNKATVKFNPDYQQQKKIAKGLKLGEEEGLNGQFVVQYDVERDPRGGEVLVKDGYFVHFFAPSDLAPLEKHIVFVLDTSGSMYATKMDQLKTAMNSILGDLNPNDYFNLVEFNTNVKVLNLDAPQESTYFPDNMDWYVGDKVYSFDDVSFAPAYPVTNNTIRKARKAVDEMEATGGTNIFEALRVALHLIKTKQQRTGDKTTQPLILFLTDGDATVGKTDPNKIISSLKEENLGIVPIISLSFGYGADRQFLQKLSLANNAFARHIYEDSDASLQLENFYKQISSPLLKDIKFKYTPDVLSLTRTEFPILFGGGEFVICGLLPSNDFKEIPRVTSFGKGGPIDLMPTVQTATGQLERLWAYLTIKKYLNAKEVSKSNSTEYEDKALELAKKYSFVTPVTSLVVVKPNDTKPVDTQNAEQGEDFGGPILLSSYPKAGLPVQQMLPTRKYFASPMLSPNYLSRPATNFVSVQNAPISPTLKGSPIASSQIRNNLSGAAGFAGFPALGGPPSTYRPTVYSADVDADADADTAIDSSYGTTTRIQELLSYEETTTVAEEEPEVFPEDFPESLNWLQSAVNPDGSLQFLKGKYRLGLNETSPVDQDCTDPNSKEGNCVLIQDCKEVHSNIKDATTFKDYFCSIEKKYAGVCCPKKHQN